LLYAAATPIEPPVAHRPGLLDWVKRPAAASPLRRPPSRRGSGQRR